MCDFTWLNVHLEVGSRPNTLSAPRDKNNNHTQRIWGSASLGIHMHICLPCVCIFLFRAWWPFRTEVLTATAVQSVLRIGCKINDWTCSLGNNNNNKKIQNYRHAVNGQRCFVYLFFLCYINKYLLYIIPWANNFFKYLSYHTLSASCHRPESMWPTSKFHLIILTSLF